MPTTTTRTATKVAKTKPYDRKGKDKALTRINEGAPAQLGQSSRKGKKAWRKNVDIRDEEEALERRREEERVTGSRVPVSDKANGDLFTIDTTGDEVVAKRMRKEKKPLRSLAILNERSALPAFTARAGPAPKKKIAGKEKARLRRIAGRTDEGSADVRKTDTEGLHDAWVAAPPQEGLEGGFGDEGVIKNTVKAPETLRKMREERRAMIEAQLADELPVAGVSYNPAAEAHSALIKKALEEELETLKKEEREAERIATLGEVVVSRRENDNEFSETVVGGMRVELADEDDEEEDAEAGFKPKPTKRKTQAQRNKAARAKAKLLEAREAAQRKRTEQGILAAKKINKDVEARQKAAAEAAKLRKIAAEQRASLKFEGGEKVGKHRVAKGSVAVQLGEDLAESLRQVKPEGNLFKDRFLSLQKRALLEPRVPQLPTRRLKVKEYEKHAWKNFK